VQESKCWKFLGVNTINFCLADSIIGTYVLQVTICQASIVQMVIIYLAFRRRGVASLMEHQTSTRHVTMGTYPGRLTGTLKGGCHAQHLVTTSRVFINPAATDCIVLKNWNAVKCRPLRGNYCEHFLADNPNCFAVTTNAGCTELRTVVFLYRVSQKSPLYRNQLFCCESAHEVNFFIVSLKRSLKTVM
jgi:hypothetical protein